MASESVVYPFTKSFTSQSVNRDARSAAAPGLAFVRGQGKRRWEPTLRRRLARLARKTLSFSKSERRHEFFVRWFLTDHNQACLKRLEKRRT